MGTMVGAAIAGLERLTRAHDRSLTKPRLTIVRHVLVQELLETPYMVSRSQQALIVGNVKIRLKELKNIVSSLERKEGKAHAHT